MAARRGNPHAGLGGEWRGPALHLREWIAPGAGAPTHTHTVEEVLTVCEGEAEMWLDQERVTVSAGQSLVVPAGRRHGFRNSGAATLHVHAVLASSIFEATFEGSAEVTRRWDRPVK